MLKYIKAVLCSNYVEKKIQFKTKYSLKFRNNIIYTNFSKNNTLGRFREIS